MSEIKKCTCGKEPRLVVDENDGFWAIECFASMGGCGRRTGKYLLQDTAVENWNDPVNGPVPTAKFTKNVKGAGKVDMNLLLVDMAEAVYEVCEVMTEGAKKHEPTGWKKVVNGIGAYTNALNRHLNAEARGEVIDPEFGKHHAAHAACSALIRLQLIIDAEKAPKEVK